MKFSFFFFFLKWKNKYYYPLIFLKKLKLRVNLKFYKKKWGYKSHLSLLMLKSDRWDTLHQIESFEIWRGLLKMCSSSGVLSEVFLFFFFFFFSKM
jgi:hypothetical protein